MTVDLEKAKWTEQMKNGKSRIHVHLINEQNKYNVM
jgi:hypothetical protein